MLNKIMKPFNLEEYLANPTRKVVTREGKPARIICTDAKFEKYPLVALITKKDGQEFIAIFDTLGKYHCKHYSYLDLFFTTEKHEGWINLYENEDGISWISPNYFTSKKAAEEEGKTRTCSVTTIKIEWEE